MEIDVSYYQQICDNFIKHCPMWAGEVRRCVPRHDHMIRVYLNNGDHVDYDNRSGTYRYNEVGSTTNTDAVTEESCRKIFAANLSDIMSIRGIGQDILSKRTGLSQGMISNYKRGRSIPSLTNAQKIANALSCELEELIR